MHDFQRVAEEVQKSQLIILDVMTARETALRELHLMEEGPIAGGMEEKHMIEGVEDDISRNSRSHLAIRSEILLSAFNFLGQRLEIENDGTIAILTKILKASSSVTNTRQTRNTRFGQNCLFYYLRVVYIYIIIYTSNPKVRSLSADCTVALSASFPFVIYVTSSSSF